MTVQHVWVIACGAWGREIQRYTVIGSVPGGYLVQDPGRFPHAVGFDTAFVTEDAAIANLEYLTKEEHQ